MAKSLILLLALAGCAAAVPTPTPAPASTVKSGVQPDGSMVVVLSPEQWKTCQGEGGCTVFSGTRLQHELEEAFVAGAGTCKKPTRLL